MRIGPFSRTSNTYSRETPLTKNHRFMAPVSWAPQIQLPSWWDTLPTDRPVVYANFGSSGRHGVLQRVLNALSTLPVTVISATAGKAKGVNGPGERLFDGLSSGGGGRASGGPRYYKRWKHERVPSLGRGETDSRIGQQRGSVPQHGGSGGRWGGHIASRGDRSPLRELQRGGFDFIK
jgi:hypothetical protein